MNSVWNLDNLYKGYDDPKFVADETKIDKLISEINNFCKNLNGNPAENLKNLIIILNEFYGTSQMLFLYAELKQSANTNDVEAAAIIGRLMQKQSAISAPMATFIKYIATIPDLQKVFDGDVLLNEHAFFLNNLKEQEIHTLSPEVEHVISLYEISGSSAWSDLQGYLTSNVPVEYRGEITNLSDIRNKAYDADPDVRLDAYKAELNAYECIKDGIAFSLNSIKMEVINRCELKGFASPLDETLFNAHMKRETLDALIGAMEEYLPKFWEYLKAKAKLMGYENGLPFFELFAPLEGNEKEYTTEETRDYLVNLFSGFDAEEAGLIKRAFNEGWIDFYPRVGKVGGAFCAGAHKISESRVLTNFGGQLGDVVTLAHELGHAFHNYCLRDNSILNIDISMPVAETASTFNEIVAMNAVIGSENDTVTKRALIESQLMDATQIICDIYSRYKFETAVFENRESGFMFADKLCELMIKAQKQGYGDGIDPEYMHPYMWACKSHYYSGGLSFYNFPYAFGGLFARGLYAKYLKDSEQFVPLYKELLKATGTTTVEGAALVAGIDLTDKQFWRDSLQILSDEIEEFISLCS